MTRDEIERRAREAVEAAGYPWVTPVVVTATRLFLFLGPVLGWQVCTDAEMRGGNVNVHLSRNGAVKKMIYVRY